MKNDNDMQLKEYVLKMVSTFNDKQCCNEDQKWTEDEDEESSDS